MNILQFLKTTNYKLNIKKHSRLFYNCGKNLVFDYKDSSFSFNIISIGNDVFIGMQAWCHACLSIGNNVTIGPKITIIGSDHLFGVIGKSVRFLKPITSNLVKPNIIIEDEVWIGANVTITKNVIIGLGAVIGAASVVTKSIPPFTVAVGNPCKPIKKIFNDFELKEHLNWLGYGDEYINLIINRRNSELQALNLESLLLYKNKD